MARAVVRVGLLGGTFDPPHLGHLVVAETARVSLELDQVRLLVAGDPWMKDHETPAEHRVAMVAHATQDDPHLSVDDREARRDGETYTADTLGELMAEEPGTAFLFLVGEDVGSQLHRWHRIDEAMALATFVVVTRHGHKLSGPLADRLKPLQVPEVEVSSTELRQRYAAGGPTRYLVPPAVDRYVREHGLYGAGLDG